MITIKEDYVSFETAKLLKEKGFPIPSNSFEDWVFCMYDENGNIQWGCYSREWYARVTLQMAMKWLREVHGVTIIIDTNDIWLGEGDRFYWFKIYYKMGNRIEIKWYNDPSNPKDILRYLTYEESVEAAIKYCLEHLI